MSGIHECGRCAGALSANAHTPPADVADQHEFGSDLGRALGILNQELGIERLLLEGGGIVNGALFRAGLIDEISLIIWPTVDGAMGAPCVFDSAVALADSSPSIEGIRHLSCETLAEGAVWLRYRVHNQCCL